ncbi:RNA polymerase III subunit RPC82-domain-containing protein [Vararia minispora EC-137]|uniref:RNA polymerase III subunit RPC82-domain-containing protein n=1 Tax=Vararia minispora EC-137 TaxID=1314806 RepID=A0ACB8Q9T9_9AGAM|nr:RNA polymerase III subunit RPC82-domain-containing protein [Vararia minispora EC-137]
MADLDTVNLCTEAVRAHFGPLVSKVTETLLRRGRLSLPHLIRYSTLKPRTVRASVLVLIQQNILWHATEDDAEVFEVNIDECLVRLRFGRYIWQTEELFGPEAANIVTAVLENGKLKPPHIMRSLTVDHKSKAVYAQALHKLVSESYLKPSTVLSHQSPRDKIYQYEAEEKAKMAGIPSAKDLREVREAAEARFRREEEEVESIGMKRKAKEHRGKVSKRSKTAVKEEEEVVDDEVYFRVNYDRFNVHIRNQIVVTAARERFNDGASAVIQATLAATLSKQKSMKDPRSDPASLADIASHIPDDSVLTSGLVFASTKKPPKALAAIKEYVGLLSCVDNATTSGAAARFVSTTSSGSRVQVEFERLGARLRQRVLEAVARERHGDDGVRVVRLLLSTGKMDERQISKVAMMPAKDVRPLLNAMAAASLVSLQEVPRTADRNPTRTFYLWFVDLPKAYRVILTNLHKTLFNIHLRRRTESSAPLVQAVLSKLERTDVSEDNLTRAEREVLASWRARRDRLTVLEMRVEEAVFILSDMAADDEVD